MTDCPPSPHNMRDCPSDDEHTQPETMVDYLELIRETLEPYSPGRRPEDPIMVALKLARQALAVEERAAFRAASEAAQRAIEYTEASAAAEVQNRDHYQKVAIATVECPLCGQPKGSPCKNMDDGTEVSGVHAARSFRRWELENKRVSIHPDRYGRGGCR
jgi:hypothetical protein